MEDNVPMFNFHAQRETRRLTRLSRRKTITTAAFCMLAFLGSPISGSYAATEFPAFGGTGDASFRDMCPPGEYLVGLRARSGSWVDQMSITCAVLKSDGTTGALSNGPTRGGNGGAPSPGPGKCQPNDIITGAGLLMTAQNKQVRLFIFNCQSTTSPLDTISTLATMHLYSLKIINFAQVERP
jgi:hypothetical protein